MSRLFTLLLPLVLLSATQAIAKPPAPCSGSTVSGTLAAQAGLPTPVAAMRRAIAQAAAQCNYGQLEKLALKGNHGFSFTFGDPQGGPARYWRQAEAQGEPVLATMVKVLAMPYAKPAEPGSDALYVWPSAYGEHPSERDWAALRPLFSNEQEWKSTVSEYRSGDGYTGPRIGITRKGDWAFCIIGGD